MDIFIKITELYALAAIISMFVALIIKLIFKLIEFTENRSNRKKQREHNVDDFDISLINKEARTNVKEQQIAAVISMAVNIYLSEIHDMENTVLTINKSVKPYSPWSSKIYSLRQSPR